MFHAASAQKYVDASTLTIIGRTCPMEGHPYYRVDTTRYRFDNATIRHYCGYPAGVAVLFTTDSRRIEARWTTAPRNYGWNMTPVLQRGMDLYVRENGVWTMAGAARPGLQDRHASTIVEHMDGQPKECMLYLPAWSELLTLEIGVDEGASVTPLESPYKHRVIVFGSSVTHGASASRPGMTYPARMSRMTGIEFVNLGYSGNCMLQPEFARLLAETDADAFLFDAFSNPSPKMIRERLDAFVATLVKAHPDKPLIFMQTHWHTAGNLDQEAAKFHRERIDTADGMMRRLAKQYDNVYFLDGEWFFGRDAEGTIDCDHGSDHIQVLYQVGICCWGMYRTVRRLNPCVFNAGIFCVSPGCKRYLHSSTGVVCRFLVGKAALTAAYAAEALYLLVAKGTQNRSQERS